MAGNQMGPIRNTPANRDYAQALNGWPSLAPGRVTVWHRDPYRAASRVPAPHFVPVNRKPNPRHIRSSGSISST